MTPKEKKELKTKILNQEGNKRSWNEITADLELELWAERFNPDYLKQRKEKNGTS